MFFLLFVITNLRIFPRPQVESVLLFLVVSNCWHDFYCRPCDGLLCDAWGAIGTDSISRSWLLTCSRERVWTCQILMINHNLQTICRVSLKHVIADELCWDERLYFVLKNDEWRLLSKVLRSKSSDPRYVEGATNRHGPNEKPAQSSIQNSTANTRYHL